MLAGDFEAPRSIGANGVASYGGDDRLIVMFYRGTRPNAPKSRAAGVPMVDPVDMIRVVHPGERDIMEYEVTADDPKGFRVRFPRQWAAYEKGQEQRASGTPLEMLYPDAPDMVTNLQALHIHTVQQLAALSDSGMGNLPFGLSARNLAKKFLGDRAEAEAENNSLKVQVAALTARLEAMDKKKGA